MRRILRALEALYRAKRRHQAIVKFLEPRTLHGEIHHGRRPGHGLPKNVELSDPRFNRRSPLEHPANLRIDPIMLSRIEPLQ